MRAGSLYSSVTTEAVASIRIVRLVAAHSSSCCYSADQCSAQPKSSRWMRAVSTVAASSSDSTGSSSG